MVEWCSVQPCTPEELCRMPTSRVDIRTNAGLEIRAKTRRKIAAAGRLRIDNLIFLEDPFLLLRLLSLLLS